MEKMHWSRLETGIKEWMKTLPDTKDCFGKRLESTWTENVWLRMVSSEWLAVNECIYEYRSIFHSLTKHILFHFAFPFLLYRYMVGSQHWTRILKIIKSIPLSRNYMTLLLMPQCPASCPSLSAYMNHSRYYVTLVQYIHA